MTQDERRHTTPFCWARAGGAGRAGGDAGLSFRWRARLTLARLVV
ncbi:MAG: hypothetical protein AVDCRST_MAG45-719 [uncultured Solirubrobacterales bacterium]|uniref:Uncharacterized protein n=1 Tax=uncultured Solirubrobacterales bacterium TaxID=768556 RepID=A0A6J4SD54_9ACTN|nr:MAG: hypothetical protein AVDCRST_MAG45-719 [uncultured Solirubrobacterales bacterium]